MKVFARVSLFAFFSAILITQYQNCSSYSEDTLFEASKIQEGTVGEDPSKMYMDMKSSTQDRHVLVGENQLQLGGVCNPGGMSDNYIEYSLFTPDNQTMNLALPGQAGVSVRRDARCENGRFHIVLFLNCAGTSASAQDFRLKMTLKAFNRDAAGNAIDAKSTTLESPIRLDSNSGYCP